MTMQELYDEMKDVLDSFGLRFNEMGKVQVSYDDDGITFEFWEEKEGHWLQHSSRRISRSTYIL